LQIDNSLSPVHYYTEAFVLVQMELVSPIKSSHNIPRKLNWKKVFAERADRSPDEQVTDKTKKRVRAGEGSGGDTDSSDKEGQSGRYSQKINELMQQIHEIRGGTNPEFMQRSGSLQKLKARRQLAADKFRNLQIENTNALFDFDAILVEKQIERVLTEAKTPFIEDLEQQQRLFLKYKIKRPKCVHKNGDEQLKPFEQENTRVVLQTRLQDDEIFQDIKDISNNLHSMAEAFLSNPEYLSKSSSCDDIRKFSVGDRVWVSARKSAGSDALNGIISAKNKSSLDINFSNGRFTRVSSQQLKDRAVKLYRRGERKNNSFEDGRKGLPAK